MFELVDQACKNTGKAHEAVLADPGFCDYEALQKAEEQRQEEYFLPDMRFECTERQRGNRGAYDNSCFRREQDGGLICPEGKPMRLKREESFADGHTLSTYEGTACRECQVREKCTKGERRTVSIDSREPFRDMMREKLRSDRGRETYMKRQGIAEPLHGDDQKNRGWKQHHLRGLAKASLEFLLIRIATNLGKMVRYKAVAIMALSP